MEYTVYLAGPIQGLSYAKAMGWRDLVTEVLPRHIRTLNPMRGKEYLAGEEIITGLTADGSVVRRDLWDIQRCDLMLVSFMDAERVGIGTCVEMGYAKGLGKPIVVAMEPDNIHNYAFITELGEVVDNLTLAMAVIEAMLSA